MKSFFSILIGFLLLLSAANLFAQKSEISSEFRTETIDAVLQLLKSKYAYPEIVPRMEAAIREKQKSGQYDSITDGNKLAEIITADLRAVFDDKHLRLSFSAEPIALRSAKSGLPTPDELEKARRRQMRQNFGLQKVEILNGNVGLIKINYFAPLEWSVDVYSAALNTVANTDALIIDVSENGGSMDIDTMPFFSSYLFDKPVQFGDIYWPETNEKRQLWTSAVVPGKKFLGKPVYLLTSRRTASGAEAFVAYLKRLKRASSIGETTAGATMPGMSHRVNEHFSIWISTGRSSSGAAENENKGVMPDTQTAPENALKTAYMQALNQLLKITDDEEWKERLKKLIDSAGE